MVALCGSSGCYDRARFEIGDSPYQYDTSQSGLVSYWPMDETTGSTVTDVSSSNDGTATGTTIVDGKYRKARSFNGSSDYINAGKDSTLDLTSTGSISVWAKPNRSYPSDDTNTKYRGIIAKTSSGGSTGLSYWIDWRGTNTSRTLRARIGDGTNSQGVEINNFDFGGSWVHIVYTFDGSNHNLYINGDLTNSPVTQTINAQILDQDLHIGRAFNSSSYTWDGLIDEVLIYNTALTQTQVDALYSSSRPSTNPSDTLYAVEISTDNFISDIKYIDGSTNEPKNDLTINDFRTKTTWEAETFNILGLQEGTEYSIRIIALHGDFTQTEEGPPASATTGGASSSFDIDIANNSGYTVETDPPFNITFTGENALLAGAGSVIADNLVWMDAETNGSGGFAIVQRGQNGGLYSSTLSTQINSVNGNLDSLSEGFGLQNYYIDYATGTGLGTITAETNYSGSASNVGIVDTDWNKVYDSNGPTVSGRMALYLMARASSDKQGATDYEESITFILVPRY